MQWPNYFNTISEDKTITTNNIICVEYIHSSKKTNDTYLIIDKPFFIFVVDGILSFFSLNETILIEKNQSAFVNTGTYTISESLSEHGRFGAYLIFYSIEILNKFSLKLNTIELNDVSKNDPKNITKVDYCVFLSAFIQSITLLFKGNYDARKETTLIDIKAEELIYYLGYNKLSNSIKTMLFQSMDKDFAFKNIVKNNYLNHTNLQDFAFLTNKSLSSFKRKFKQVYNETPSKWIKNKRLEHSISLLNANKYKIKEIANKCGFDNANTFSRLFKIKHGVSPKDYK